MAVYTVSGSSAGVFTWTASWDSATKDLTIDADGSGRSTVTVAQSTGQMRTVAFVQATGDTPLAQAPGLPAPTLTIVIGDPATVIQNLNLKPTTSTKDGSGGFEVVNESWSRI